MKVIILIIIICIFFYILIRKKKIILCLFGVIPRSINKTWDSIKTNIIDVLEQNNFKVDIYVFNLNVLDIKVDGKILNQNNIKIIPYNYYEEKLQTDLDIILEKKCISGCKFIAGYDELMNKNAMRQLYSEYMVGKFLEKNNKYDLSIVCGPDYYIANNINIQDINNSLINNNIYISQVNKSGGLTNGFYFGKSLNLVPLLKRYEDFKTGEDVYESTIVTAINTHNIKYKLTDIVFFKIRANNNIDWQGNKRVDFIKDENVKKKIINKYNKLIQNSGV